MNPDPATIRSSSVSPQLATSRTTGQRNILPAPAAKEQTEEIEEQEMTPMKAGSEDGLMSTPTIHRCETCGKSYKNRNCLLKHGWEHHDMWAASREVCASKHQQVQLMEAAQLLVEIGRKRESQPQR